MRHALAIYESKSIYTFIPKNACSTMRYSLARNNGFINESTHVDWHHSNNLTFTASQEYAATIDYAFVILRCPFRRIASAFLDKVVTANLVTRSIFPKKYEKVLLRINGKKMFHDLSFKDFLSRIEKMDPMALNQHWRPQSDFLLYEKYDDYFSVERFAQFEAQIAERIGFKVYDTRERVGHDTTRFEKIDGDFSSVSAGELFNIRSNGQLPSYQSLFDDEALEITSRIYGEDIALFKDKFGVQDTLF